MTKEKTECRIYVACLAAYNNGKLHGRWIDADQDADAIWAEVQTMLRESPEPNAEEWAIHDQEGFAGALDEHTSFADVAALAAAIEEHGEIFANFYARESGNYSDIDSAVSDFQGKYQGEWDKLEDYVENFWDDMGYKGNPDQWWHPSNYVEWERMAHDLQTSGDIFTIELNFKTHVFNNH